jgi:pimeloyl-ACP methyl ester carboxylesterase
MEMTRRAVVAGLALSGCAAASAAGRIALFQAIDGMAVTGHSFGEGSPAVVLVPGGHGVGETWHLQAKRLARSGFRVLAIDFRGRGGARATPPDDEKAHLDVLGAVRQLKAEGADRVSVVGASWGGWAAGTASIAAPGEIERLVLLAHSPFENPERLEGRKLFVVAREDRDGTGRPRLDSIQKQFESAPEPKEMVVLGGAAHAQFLFLTPEGERLYDEILRFLSAD